MRPRIWVSGPIIDAELHRLHELAEVTVRRSEIRPTAAEAAAEATGTAAILPAYGAPVDASVMDAAGSSLRLIANFGVGYDNIDVRAATDRGIAVSNTPDAVVSATADIAFGLLLAAARRFGEGLQAALEDRWLQAQAGMLGQELEGATLGIIGLGRIGAAVARRAGGFGMKIGYSSRTRKPELEQALRAQYRSLGELLAESDFISLHCALTPETRHILDAHAFARMKKSAIVINTGRGGLIDQPALIQAVRAGLIAGAGLDVTDPEPPAIDDPVLHTPGIFVLPHLGSASYRARAWMTRICVDNILAMLRGEPLPNCVNAVDLESRGA